MTNNGAQLHRRAWGHSSSRTRPGRWRPFNEKSAGRRFGDAGIEPLERRVLLAANYFVSATAGSDSNSGSADAPWRSLTYAARQVEAGDTVTVRPGNYAGFYFDTDGTPQARITFSAEPGVVIDRGTSAGDGISLEGADYVTVEGFTVVGLSHAGIRSVENTGVIIRNNVVDGIGYTGILTGFSDGVLVENNVSKNGRNVIYIGNTTANAVVRRNRVFNNSKNGMHFNGDESLGGTGVITGALVEGNIVYGNGATGGGAINMDGVQSSVIRNNLLYRNRFNGINLYQIDGSGPSKNNVIANNTVVGTRYWDLQIIDGATGNVVLNNIFYNDRDSGTRGAILISADSRSGFVSDYNAVSNLFNLDEDEGAARTLAQWRADTGQDSHSILITSLSAFFADPAANDYRLRDGSPAADAGIPSLASKPAALADLAGTTRPQGAGFDIGAYELRRSLPPVVTAAAFDDAAPANSLRVTFSADVSASLEKEDLTLLNLVTGATIAASETAVSWDPAGKTAIWTFPGLTAGSLPDGWFRATLSGVGISDASGAMLDGNADGTGGDSYSLTFSRLSGDINRDLQVDSRDFSILATHFGRAAMSYAQGDLTADGTVNSSDFVILAGNFGRRLPAEAPAPPAAVPAESPAPAVATPPPPLAAVTTAPAAPARRNTSDRLSRRRPRPDQVERKRAAPVSRPSAVGGWPRTEAGPAVR